MDLKMLHILWTTGEKEVAMKVVFPYIINSKANGWWDEINLIIWGPSAKLTAGDLDIHRQLKDVMDSGITVEACQACTDSYRVPNHCRTWESPYVTWVVRLLITSAAGPGSLLFKPP
jgi:hypothetical protein